MSFRPCPVASFRKRAVYKTEFDLFKQNTELDLISLISYQEDEDSGRIIADKPVNGRPKTVPCEEFVNQRLASREKQSPVNGRIQGRPTERKFVTKSAIETSQTNAGFRKGLDTGSKQSHARIKCETEIYKDFAKVSKGFLKPRNVPSQDRARQCLSALDIRDRQQEPLLERSRSQTTCGFRPTDRNRLINGYQNKSKTKINTRTKQRETAFKPIVSVNLVTTVNKAWLLRTAAITGHDLSSNIINQHNKRPFTGRSLKTNDSDFPELSDITSLKKAATISEISSNSSKTTLIDSTYQPLNENIVNTENETKSANYNRSEVRTYEISQHEACPRTDVSSIDKKKWVPGIDRYEYEEKDCSETLDNSAHLRSNSFSHSHEYIGSKDSGIDSNTASPECDFATGAESENVKSFSTRHVQFSQHANSKQNNEDDLNLESISNIDQVGSDRSSELDIDEPDSNVGYDVNDLISDLERFGNQSRLSVASGGVLSHQGFEESNSLITESVTRTVLQPEQPVLQEEREEHTAVDEEAAEEQEVSQTLDDIVMSREARHAILETLNDMGGTTKNKRNSGKENFSANIRHKSVNAQKKMKDNRSKYDHYTKERNVAAPRNQFQSLDSLGNEEVKSQLSSPMYAKGCVDDDSSCERDQAHGKLFPSIRENTKLSKGTMKSSSTKSKVYSLDQVKNKKYKIPGIGNYNLTTSPENDFEITPPGFDSRYTPKPFISKEEQEIPPRFIRERSILKCKKWLDNVNLSPMSLKPVNNKGVGS